MRAEDTRNATWIHPELYPYRPKSFPVPAGTLRYLDEGQGEPIVMVHGNPTWSFVYRKLVAALRDNHRCIVPDHIGFGQSDKPADWTYLPRDHAANLERLLIALDVRDLTLVVQDWGGPVGLSFALTHPDRVKRLVILNTWMWPVNDDWYYQMFSRIVGGPIGRLMCRRFNLFVRFVMPAAYGKRERLTPEIHRHYFEALPTPDSRKGTWVFPKQIIGSTEWLNDLWAQRDKLSSKPVMIAWGMKDIAFRENELRRWQSTFPHAQVTRFEDAGHYVQDESGEQIADLMHRFIQLNP